MDIAHQPRPSHRMEGPREQNPPTFLAAQPLATLSRKTPYNTEYKDSTSDFWGARLPAAELGTPTGAPPRPHTDQAFTCKSRGHVMDF